MLKLGLSAPWYTYRNKIAALFYGDEEVEVGQLVQDGKSYRIDITISNAVKACAISQLIPSLTKFGNVSVNVKVLVPNASVEDSDTIDLDAAFEGNPNVDSILEITDFTGTVWTYVMFKKSHGIVQFYNDDISDPHGFFNGLISDVAREVFLSIPSVNYSISI